MTDCTLDSSFQVSLPIQGTGGHKVIPKLKYAQDDYSNDLLYLGYVSDQNYLPSDSNSSLQLVIVPGCGILSNGRISTPAVMIYSLLLFKISYF